MEGLPPCYAVKVLRVCGDPANASIGTGIIGVRHLRRDQLIYASGNRYPLYVAAMDSGTGVVWTRLRIDPV